jgi:hypothetical protein
MLYCNPQIKFYLETQTSTDCLSSCQIISTLIIRGIVLICTLVVLVINVPRMRYTNNIQNYTEYNYKEYSIL